MSSKNFVSFGDYNYPAINWKTNTISRPETDEAEQFLGCIEDNYCTQHVPEPTRDHNTLDLVISNDPKMVYDVEIMGRLDTSDHNMISVNLNFDKLQHV